MSVIGGALFSSLGANLYVESMGILRQSLTALHILVCHTVQSYEFEQLAAAVQNVSTYKHCVTS